jgi:hypothetical protein
LTVEVRTVPLLTAVFGAYIMVEQSPRDPAMSAKKQPFAKADAIWVKRNVLTVLPSDHLNGASRRARTCRVIGAKLRQSLASQINRRSLG